jgi:predicted double-glycine peptidase
MKKFRLLNLCIIIQIFIFKAYSDQLDIPNIEQETNFTCWAACCEMIFRAYGNTTITQEQIAIEKGIGADKWNTANGILGALLYYSPNVISLAYDRAATMSEIVEAISGSDTRTGRVPMIAIWKMTPGDEHAVLIIGVSGNNIIYNDPEDGDNAIPRQLSYEQFKKGTIDGILHTFTKFIRLQSSPPIPIPTGIGSNEYLNIITYTSLISQVPQTLNFSAQKYGDHTPITWTWRLLFPYDDGDYLAAYWSYNGSQFSSTWTISNFILPSGYNWKYNSDGKIPARVEVVVNDNNGPPAHDNSRIVYYQPSQLYPGRIDYIYQTVSNPQADLVAHENINAKFDQFLNGGSISLRSGSSIELNDGITIQNGGVVNLVVDPNLR